MLEVTILAVLQGIAEFLPISSSGHLVIGQHLLGLGGAGMRLDVFLHVGTLISIAVFYFSRLVSMVRSKEWVYCAKILVSALPAVAVYFCFPLAEAACPDHIPAAALPPGGPWRPHDRAASSQPRAWPSLSC